MSRSAPRIHTGIRVSDLPEMGHVRGAFLYCAQCRQLWSACRGDYFALHDSHVMTCCDKPMRLMRQRVVLEAVRT